MAAAGEGAGFLEVESEEELIKQHKKERKDLQAQIQKLKNSVPKGDKKKKKEVAEQIALLEADLDKRQDDELEQFKGRGQKKQDTVTTEVTSESKELEAEQEEDGEGGSGGLWQDKQDGKKSKAQKRREKKQAKDKDREAKIREQEVENRQGPRQLELKKITALLKERGLAIHEIPADGNCMYNAINHQLATRNEQSSNEKLRKQAAEYMRQHKDDFLPFLTNPDTGDMLTEDEFETYCDKTAKSPMWGGQIELRALSEALTIPFEIVQADTQPILIGENIKDKEPVILVYHRHVFRLGEHYNSVKPIANSQEEEGEEAIQTEQPDDDGLK